MTNSKMTEEQIKEKRSAELAVRSAFVEKCRNVSGRNWMGLEEEIFRYDRWHVDEALDYLVGAYSIQKSEKDPSLEFVVTLEYKVYEEEDDADVVAGFLYDRRYLKAIWGSGNHQSVNPPNYYIEWALSKGYKINWLDLAIENGWISNINNDLLLKTTISKKELFDKENPTYPPELDLAMQAWEAVKDDKSKGKPKAKVRAWLDANTKLSNEAKDRISIVVNWDKSGGATRTD